MLLIFQVYLFIYYTYRTLRTQEHKS